VPFVRDATVEVVWLGIVVVASAKVDDPVRRSYKRYPVMAEPPFDAGACHEREICPLAGVAVSDWGGDEVVFPTVTVTSDEVATLLKVSVMMALNVWLPSVELAVFHET
jgi:hypothetical protein